MSLSYLYLYSFVLLSNAFGQSRHRAFNRTQNKDPDIKNASGDIVARDFEDDVLYKASPS